MQNVLIFFGGVAPEHDISVITGVLTANALDKGLYKVIPVYIHNDGVMYYSEQLLNLDFYKKTDLSKCCRVTLLSGDNKIYTVKKKRIVILCEAHCAINCLHGNGGEDGTLCGLLKNTGIPLASPDIFASALAIDKHFTKIALKSTGVRYAEYMRIKRDGFFQRRESVCRMIIKKIGLPIIVKPATLGSSIGIKRVDNENELFTALCEALNYDSKAICEKYIENALEINCAAYSVDGKITVSELEKPFSSHDILTFEDKYGGYKSGTGNKEFPAVLPEEICNIVKDTVKKVYSEFDFNGIVRFDFLIAEKTVYLNEINAVPGSLAYYLFCKTVSEFSELLSELIKDAQKRKREEERLIGYFQSDILSGNWQPIKK